MLFSHVAAIPKILKYLNNVFVSNHNSNISSSDNVQKAVDLTIPAKKKKENEFSDQKVHDYDL